jgi:hypothetical protein
MFLQHKPFLWNFIEIIQFNQDATNAREKGTESANEESCCSIIEMSENDK